MKKYAMFSRTVMSSPLAALRSGGVSAKWKQFACNASLALSLGGLVNPAQASILVYEGFDYDNVSPPASAQTTDANLTSLDAQTGGTGFTGGWVAGHTNFSPYANPKGFAICNSTMQTIWNGTSTKLVQTGKFAGSPAPVMAAGSLNGNTPDQMFAYRPLDSSVTATFTLGTVQWLCFEQCTNFKANGNGLGASLSIGAGHLGTTAGNNRGNTSYGGGAIGIGMLFSHNFTAGVWGAGTAAGALVGPSGSAYATTGQLNPRILIAKITWGDSGTPTTIEQCTFTESDTITEATFNSAVSPQKVSNSATFDPSTYTTLSLGGARYNVDEIRLATTFDEALGVVAASDGPYWAPGVTGGGTGTWASGSNFWAVAPNIQGTASQSPAALLIFGGATGTVTIDGTATAGVGMQFTTDAYSVVAGASSPNLVLGGASAAANTITCDTSKTATVSAIVNGSNGLTKAGAGILILDNVANGYSGSTELNNGTLQIAALGSLGSSTVTFGAGTLKYAAASPFDVSSRIAAVPGGQVAKIDTNGNDVTFASSIGGSGGLTKSGAGSLTITAANTLLGPVTCSAGTLNIDSTSGTVVTLDVPTGGTVNLGAGAVIINLNITGGTVNVTGAGVTVDALNAPSGTLDADPNSLAIGTSATVAGVRILPSSGSTIILSGNNVITPDAGNRRTITAGGVDGGTISLAAIGLSQAIGIGSPGANASPTTASFSGAGAWTLNGGVALNPGNFYGLDNHCFQYIPIPLGNFEIIAHVTGTTNAQAGIMVRNTLAGSPAPSPVPPNPLPFLSAGNGNWMAMWTQRAAYVLDGVQTIMDVGATGTTPYLKITRVGDVMTSYYSINGGLTYTKAQQRDFSTSVSTWGPNTYIGLDLTDTQVLSVSGSFDNVNFMGSASIPELTTTDFVINNDVTLDLPTATSVLGNLSHGVNDVHFTGTTGASFADISGSGVLSNEGAVDCTITVRSGSSSFTGTIADGATNKTGFTLGGGTFTLGAGNSYTGNTGVTDGTLTISAKYLDDASNVLIGSTGVLNLAHSTSPPDTISALFIAGVQKPIGTWGNSSSSPTNPDNTHFTGSGNLLVTVAPPLTPYEQWSLTRGLTGAPGSSTDPAFNADPDRDSLANGMEWVLGGDPLALDPAVLPTVVTELNGSLTLTFKRAITSIGKVTLDVQFGNNLNNWLSTTVGTVDSGPDGNGVVIDIQPFDVDFELITVAIPALNAVDGKLVSRLHVTQP